MEYGWWVVKRQAISIQRHQLDMSAEMHLKLARAVGSKIWRIQLIEMGFVGALVR